MYVCSLRAVGPADYVRISCLHTLPTHLPLTQAGTAVDQHNFLYESSVIDPGAPDRFPRVIAAPPRTNTTE